MFKKEIIHLSYRVNILEQNALECHVEIVGVPVIQNEVSTETVSKIATKLGINIRPKNAFPILSKYTDKPRKLSVYLSSIEENHTFMDTVKKQKLVAKFIDGKWSNNAIYVNNQLTSVFRNLFFKTRSTVKEVGYKYIWLKIIKYL